MRNCIMLMHDAGLLEVIAAGIAHNLSAILGLSDPVTFVGKRIKDFWAGPEAWEFGKAGVRGSDRIQRTLPFGQRWFDPAVQT
jgi:hypothetical protein